MAQTPDQWYAKIRKWVPSYLFEKEHLDANPLTPALFMAIATFFSQIQTDTDDAQGSTFIVDAVAPVLDLHGSERSVSRLTSESDPSYSGRIRASLFLAVGSAQIASAVNATLNSGVAFFIENRDYGFYDDGDITTLNGTMYLDDYYFIWLDELKWYNWWTVLIPAQPPGASTDAQIMANIISAIESNKALGTTYDVVYTSTGIMTTEGGNTLTTEGGEALVTET